MGVEAGRGGRICFAGHKPGGTVVGVAVTFTIDGHHVEEDVVAHFVATVEMEIVVVAAKKGTGEGDSYRRKHPPLTLQIR